MSSDVFTGVRVTGHGKVSAKPDHAVAQFSAYARATNAGDASAAATTAMRAMIDAAANLGIEEIDRQTKGMSLSSWREMEGQPLTYHASQQLQLRLRDVDSAGEFITTVLSVAGNSASLDGFHLAIEDKRDLLVAARDVAMADARQRAEQLATLSNRSLGSVVAVVESGGRAPDQPMAYEKMAMAMDAAGSAPVEAGEIDVEVHVQVDYAWGP